MKKSYVRFFFRSYAAIVITTTLLNLSGTGNYVVHALTTTIDDIPGAAITIPDPAAGASCTASITRTINVPSLQIADINIGLNITHTRRSDVRVTLTSPAGTTVALISGQGLGS